MRIAVCDDNTDICDDIRSHVETHFMTNADMKVICDIYHSGREIVDAGKTYDIVFMDVEMPEVDGIEACRLLAKMNRHTLFIMITSHRRYLDDAIDVRAFRFLDKPVDWEHFDKCLTDAVYASSIGSRKTAIRHGSGVKVVYSDDIISAETINRRVHIYTEDGEYISSEKMSSWESKLDMPGFYSTARGVIVNMGRISSLDDVDDVVVMDNGRKIVISRRRKKSFMAAYLAYLNSIT